MSGILRAEIPALSILMLMYISDCKKVACEAALEFAGLARPSRSKPKVVCLRSGKAVGENAWGEKSRTMTMTLTTV